MGAAAESPSELVPPHEGSGEGGNDHLERVSVLGLIIHVNPEVTEDDVKIPVGVEVGQRKNMVVGERRSCRVNRDGFLDVNFHDSSQ